MRTIVCIWLSLLFILACLAPAINADDGADLVAGKCTMCHNAARICNNLGVKSSSEWSRTVDRMIAKGARVSGNDKALVLTYLSGATPGTAPFCK